jgi:hypothetical protein
MWLVLLLLLRGLWMVLVLVLLLVLVWQRARLCPFGCDCGGCCPGRA